MLQRHVQRLTLVMCTAVMVHPDDERYKYLLGQKVVLPLINREIEIIADEHVDMSLEQVVLK